MSNDSQYGDVEHRSDIDLPRRNESIVYRRDVFHQEIAIQVMNWKVLEMETVNDHWFIYFELRRGKSYEARQEETKQEVGCKAFKILLAGRTDS